MMQEPEAMQGCRCPEVHVDGEWVPFCEAGVDQVRRLPDAACAEPVNFRCPDCKRGIVRTGVKLDDAEDMERDGRAVAGHFGVEPPPRNDDHPWVRIDFRCCSCRWRDDVHARTSWGMVADA
jgi:hypothetical protein